MILCKFIMIGKRTRHLEPSLWRKSMDGNLKDTLGSSHDGVIKWEHFPRYWPFVRGIHRSPVDSPHKGQWRRDLMFSLVWAWTNGSANSRFTGDLRRHGVHCDVIVMKSCLLRQTAILNLFIAMRINFVILTTELDVWFIWHLAVELTANIIFDSDHWVAPRALSQYKDGLSRYEDFHYEEYTGVRPSYIYNGYHHAGKTTWLYWGGPRESTHSVLIIRQYTWVIIGNGLSHARCQSITWTNVDLLPIRPLGSNFSELLFRIEAFSLHQMYFEMSSAKYRPFYSFLDMSYVIVISEVRRDPHVW